MGIALTIAVVVTLTIIPTLASKRNRDKSWAGTVIDVKGFGYQRNYGDDSHHHEEGVPIKYRLDDEKQSILKVNMAT